jgi:hypothetical protein
VTITAQDLIAALDECHHVRERLQVCVGSAGYFCINWGFAPLCSDEFAAETLMILTGQIARECQRLNHTLTILPDRCRIEVHDPEGWKKSIEHVADGPFAVLFAFEAALRRGTP